MSKIIGYKRVSTFDQTPDNQLRDFVLDKVFVDHVSGRTIERPALKEMLAYVRDGDHVIVHAMDRLARNTQDLLYIVNYLNSNDVSIRFVQENLSFDGASNPMGKLMLTMIGAIAEFELALLQERQREGIKRAQAEGKYKGRPKSNITLTPSQIEYVRYGLSVGIPQTKLARELSVTRHTIRSFLPTKN